MLHRLQSIDSQADARRARLDEINALLGANEEVRAARERLDAVEEQLRAAQAHTTDLELEIASGDAKAKATTERLYGGATKNVRVMEDMEQELAALGRRREELEDDLLEAMVALDERQAQTDQARAELKAIEDKWAASQGDLAGEKQELEARLSELQAEREALLPQIDANSLSAYEKLRARLRGVAVATVEDGVCTACGVAPTSSVVQKARHGELDARCPTCGRILYAP
jgi:predicted  nucleic acid-binding Zn-ribbon protein